MQERNSTYSHSLFPKSYKCYDGSGKRYRSCHTRNVRFQERWNALSSISIPDRLTNVRTRRLLGSLEELGREVDQYNPGIRHPRPYIFFSERYCSEEPANAIVGWLLERVLKIRICVSALVEEFEKLGKASKEQLEQGKPPDKYWFWQRYFHTRTMH